MIKDLILRVLEISFLGSFCTDWTLKNRRYVPGLKKMLISAGQLDDEGHYVILGDQQWKVVKGNVLLPVVIKRGLYTW